MKITKKIMIALCALFIQSTPCIKAMEIQPYQAIFNQPDIMNCLVENFDTPLTTFYNLCLTNKDLYKNWDNIEFWKKLSTQTGYFKKEFLDQNPKNPFFYRPLILDIEDDIFQLMGVSLRISTEDKRRRKRNVSENMGDFRTYDSCEIEIRTPVNYIKTLELLSKIRTRVKQNSPEFPLDSLSIFSLDARVKLWKAEGVFLTYLKGHWDVPESESDQKSDLAFEYLNIIFPIKIELPYFVVDNSIKIFELYWFTMLTQPFFQKHQEIALLFGLIAKKEKALYLVNSTTNQTICYQNFQEFSFQLGKNNCYLGEKFIIDMEKLSSKRKECLKFALENIPDAWDLYQEHLKYEDYDEEEIGGLSKPY